MAFNGQKEIIGFYFEWITLADQKGYNQTDRENIW